MNESLLLPSRFRVAQSPLWRIYSELWRYVYIVDYAVRNLNGIERVLSVSLTMELKGD